ncbi:MAG: segregation/condensation protein A [bacterium]
MLDNGADGIEILVEMAKNSKIDPWNIDIVDVTDKFLLQIVEMKSHNLMLTGRTLFYAALLLRMKSDVLEGIDPLAEQDALFEEFDEFSELIDEPYFEEEINRNNVVSLDNALSRRTSVKANRQRVVTLKDLIRQLKFYEKIEKTRQIKSAHDRVERRSKSYANFTAEDILDMAHEEYVEEELDKVYNALLKLFDTQETLTLQDLIRTGMDKATTYISLLFLAASDRIDLVQNEFYSDLYIVPEAG